MHLTHSDASAKKHAGPLFARGWFAAQSPEFRAWVERHGRWRSYCEGAAVCMAAEPSSGLCGLGAGAIEATLTLAGDASATIFRCPPGIWFGEGCALGGASRSWTMSAARDSEVFHVPAGAVRRLLAQEPRHWGALMALGQLNTSFAVTLLAETMSLSPRARLARLVLRLADDAGRVHARHDDLARLIGMTRSSLQRALRGMTENGALSLGYRQMVIADRAAVARVAEGP